MTPTAKPCYNAASDAVANHLATAFCHRALEMRNWLIYRVYHDVIGQTDGGIISRWCAIFISSAR